MNASQHKRVEDLFDHLIQLPSNRRREELDLRCVDDMEVYAEVERLLDGVRTPLTADDSLFLKQFPGARGSNPEPGEDPLIGALIGNYYILEQLAGGGFGMVYKAEQRRPFKRIVALKIIKLGFDSKEVIARFNSERQALARMDHPNIAKVLDAGSTDAGRPYFAMEYVAGVSITKFADNNKLSIKDRLPLFLQVCDAVAHAHQKAIIHRDIKASNVMAYLLDGMPHVKVIDFGIAKALTSDRLTDLTFNTAQGMAIGTYESMSPEQAAGSPDIDTSSDIYSLGVLLYELLTGVAPFDKALLAKVGHAEACRVIRDVEPSKPSTKLNASRTDGARAAELRQSDVDSLVRQLRRELEWIPLKAMRKERERRYRSVQEMAEDIGNYLHGRPLIAGPETRVYRFTKFVWQNARLAAALMTVILVLVLGIFATTFEAVRATRAKQAAEQSEALAVSEATVEARAIEKADELFGLTLLEHAQRLRDKHECFAAAMTAAYALGFDGDFSGPSEPMTRALLRPDTGSWNQAIDLTLMPSARLIWRNRAGDFSPAPCVCFSADGSKLASESSDGVVHIWDATTGAPIQTIRCDQNQLAGASFSPDGKSLTLVADSGTAFIRLELASNRSIEAFHLDNHRGDYEPCSSFSADGKTLVSILPDESVYLWDAQSDQPPRPLPGPQGTITSVALSPDGRVLAWGLRDNTIQLSTPNVPQPRRMLQPSSDVVISLAFSTDGRTLVSGSRDRTIRIWDTDTGELLKTFQGDRGAIHGVSVSPDRRIVAAGSDNGTIQLWDVATGELLEILRGSPGKLASVRFSPGGQTLAWASNDGAVGLWDVHAEEPLKTLVGHTYWIASVCISPNGKQLASASYDKTVGLWDLSRGALVHSFYGAAQPFFCTCFSPSGGLLACGSAEGAIRLWDLADYKLLKIYDETGGRNNGGNQDHGILTAQFSPDGKVLACGARDNLIRLWDVASGNALCTFTGHTAEVCSVNFSPDGKLLASASEDTTVRVWDLSSGKLRQVLAGHSGMVTAVRFSPDGKLLASSSKDGTICLWDATTGGKLAGFAVPAGTAITSISFSPTGDMLAAGSDDNIVRIWDVRRRKQLQTLLGHKLPVYTVCFSPDGRTLASGSDDDTIKLWAIQPIVPLRQYLAAYRFDGLDLVPLSNNALAGENGFKAQNAAELALAERQGTEK